MSSNRQLDQALLFHRDIFNSHSIFCYLLLIWVDNYLIFLGVIFLFFLRFLLFFVIIVFLIIVLFLLILILGRWYLPSCRHLRSSSYCLRVPYIITIVVTAIWSFF